MDGCRSRREQFQDEFAASMKKMAADFAKRCESIRTAMEKKSLTKTDREEVTHALDMLLQDIRSNTPFVHQQFERAVDGTIKEAKGEIEAFYTHAVMKAGWEMLAAKNDAGPRGASCWRWSGAHGTTRPRSSGTRSKWKSAR